MITCKRCGQVTRDPQVANCPACGEPLHVCEVLQKTDVVLISNAMHTWERRLPDARDTVQDHLESDTAEEMLFPPPEPETAPPTLVTPPRQPSAPGVTVPRHLPPRRVVPAREVHLVVTLGRSVVGEYRFHSGVVSFGRDPLQDIVLDNPSVSRLHCKIRVDDDGEHAVLEDLGTANGTFLNRQEVRRAQLKPGDEIGVGKFSVLFQPSAQRVALLEMRARAPRSSQAEEGETCFLTVSQVHRIHDDQAVELGAHLKIVGTGRRPGRRIALRGGTTVLGRGRGADVPLRGLLVASRHVLIARRGERFHLIHSGGLRPVWVNGRPVRECTLKHRDEIRVAGNTFRFFSAI